MEKEFTKGNKYEIYIGLKDQDSYEEILTVKDFKIILREACKDGDIGFSLLTQFGGYAHNKGYTTETSLRIVIIGADDEEIEALSALLKKRVNTDTVLVSRSQIEYAFL